jgi:lauroyl/myristoyl acyltransferase
MAEEPMAEEPTAPVAAADKAAAALAQMTLVNVKLEGWIRARPDQWLWLHRRWTGAKAGQRRRRRPDSARGEGSAPA